MVWQFSLQSGIRKLYWYLGTIRRKGWYLEIGIRKQLQSYITVLLYLSQIKIETKSRHPHHCFPLKDYERDIDDQGPFAVANWPN